MIEMYYKITFFGYQTDIDNFIVNNRDPMETRVDNSIFTCCVDRTNELSQLASTINLSHECVITAIDSYNQSGQRSKMVFSRI